MTEKTSEQVEKDMRAGLDDALNDIQRIADEVRLKLHLGKMDAKDKWTELEPEIAEFEKRVEKAAEQTGDELVEVGRDLKKRLSAVYHELVRGSGS